MGFQPRKRLALFARSFTDGERAPWAPSLRALSVRGGGCLARTYRALVPSRCTGAPDSHGPPTRLVKGDSHQIRIRGAAARKKKRPEPAWSASSEVIVSPN